MSVTNEQVECRLHNIELAFVALTELTIPHLPAEVQEEVRAMAITFANATESLGGLKMAEFVEAAHEEDKPRIITPNQH